MSSICTELLDRITFRPARSGVVEATSQAE